MAEVKKQRKGFAVMDKKRVSEIAAMGGRAKGGPAKKN